ncbi:putative UDP-glucosyltransferase YojK [Brevipalpus obovatus]|uniref:putative UDP-glucosyltransferase YojK n=1 Tax=Brevipalpus obovatus TaxID=246614 RepID=UPI003D9EA765
MGKSYRILITAIPAMGHINPAIGMGDLLKARGHHIIFTQIEKFRKIAEEHGFEFIPFDAEVVGEDMGSMFIKWVLDNSEYFGSNWLEKVKNLTEEDSKIFSTMFTSTVRMNNALDKVLDQVTVDCTISDLGVNGDSIALIRRKDKLVNIPLISFNPMSIYPGGPQSFGSGLSMVNPDRSLWAPYKEKLDILWSDTKRKRREWMISEGMESLADKLDNGPFVPTPDHIGFYHYPEDLDYTPEFGPTDPGWIRIDYCIREADSSTKFEVPEVLKDKPGKLIYFSLGSLATCDLKAMKRILDILAKSPHRFIVSTGPLSDQVELADNMWGEPYVDQLKVLQAVDMAIIHGGNNSFIETIYFARPLIVIPYFFDQLDNAQRVEDKGLGRRVDIWNTSESELLKIIEDTLTNTEAHEKIRKVSENMRSSTSRERAAKMIEDLIEERKKSIK